MKQRAPALYALVVIAGVVALSVHEQSRKEARDKAQAAERDAAFVAAKNAKDDPAEREVDSEGEGDPVEAALPPSPTDARPSPARFDLMSDGTPVPALPSDAPSKIKVGLAIFRYEGAQSPPPSDRTRSDALALAKKAIEAGRESFDAAVKLGDRGSNENVGWMQQGILEPAVEYAVFSLGKGELSPEPIDTPRGFWVVKRLR